MLENLEQQLS